MLLFPLCRRKRTGRRETKKRRPKNGAFLFSWRDRAVKAEGVPPRSACTQKKERQNAHLPFFFALYQRVIRNSASPFAEKRTVFVSVLSPCETVTS